MGIIWFTGFETGNLFDGLMHGNFNIAAAPSGMSGSYAARMNASNYSYALRRLDQAYSEIYMAFLHRPTDNVGAYAQGVCGFWKDGTHIATVCRDTSAGYPLYICRDTTWLVTGSTGITSNTTYVIEVYLKIDDVSGSFKVWINGNLDIDYSGDTKGGTETTLNIGYIGNGRLNSFNNSNGYYDDWIFSTERIHPVYSQAKKIQAVLPTGAGNYSQFTGAYTDVNERPKNDSTRIYTNTVGQRSSFAMGDLSGSIESIDGIKLCTRQLGTNYPTPRNMKPFVRLGGTDYDGSDCQVPILNSHWGEKLWLLHPGTSNPFSTSDINGIECGVLSAT